MDRQSTQIVFENPLSKGLLSLLAGIFYVAPQLVVGVAVLFLFNVVATLWLAWMRPERLAIDALRLAGTRFRVYLLLLPASVVLSNMAEVLQLFSTVVFAGVGAWEFVVTAATLARVSPQFAPVYLRLAEWVRSKTPLAPSEQEIDEELERGNRTPNANV